MTRRRRAREGFTLLEVMISLVILLIGIIGVVQVQRAVIHANVDSRMTATATVNNERWAAILRRSALAWTDDTTLLTAPYVSAVGGGYHYPRFGTGTDDPFAVDWYGRAAAQGYYCTIVDLRWLVQQKTMRADVVTFWARSADERDGSASFFRSLCDGSDASAARAATSLFGTPPDPRLRHVRTTAVLRRSLP